MTDLTIRLDDLHELAALLPEATPPRMVAEVARWAVEMGQPEDDPPGGDCFSARVIEDFEVIEDDAPESVESGVSLPEASEADLVHLFGAREARVSEPEPEQEQEPEPAPAPVEDEARAIFAAAIVDTNAPTEEPPTPVPAPAPSHPFGKTWTDADDETLLSMYQSGARLVEIADALGRSVRAVDLRRSRLAKTDPRAKPAVKGSAAAAAAKVDKRPAAAKPKPATPASATAGPPAADPVAQLMDRLAELDDNFEPADDELLVRQRYIGVGFADIAAELGCDDDTAKARWREILKCGVKHAGGIVSEKGWQELRSAVALRAAEASAEG